MDLNKLSHLKDLRTEAVEALEAELVAEYQTVRTQELTVNSVTELTNLSTAINEVRSELAGRAAEAEKAPEPTAEELASAVAEADAAVEVPVAAEEAPAEELARKGEKAGDSAKDDEPDADDDDARTASAEEEAAPAELSPADVKTDPAVAASTDVPAVIVAGADIPSTAAGSDLPDFRAVAEAFISRRKSLRGASAQGDGDDVIVASIQGNYPEERKLTATDGQSNMEKIKAVASPEAVTASGGLCAPLEPYYGIQVISSAVRPVRDALPKFQADRGGVRFLPPPVLTDLNSAIGVTTASEDAGTYGTSEGDTPFKPCLHVTCGQEQTVEIEAIHRCLTFGNFAARTFPEQVEAWLALSIANHARRAETLLLDAIDTASTATTGAASYSAVRTLLPQIDQAVAAYRSRNRAVGLNFRVLIPDWTKELLRADLARGFQAHDVRDVLAVTDQEIQDWFSVRGVNVTFYIDGATGSSQVFGAQSAGALTAFPSTVIWYLYVEGSFVFLDGGVLDLGLVRDSTLNKTNDYQIFAESFEAVAFYGVESIKVTSTVCPNGVYAPAATGHLPC